jgi:hypothetical protein
VPDQEFFAAKLTSTNLLPEAVLTNTRQAAAQNEVHPLRRTILAQNLAALHVHLLVESLENGRFHFLLHFFKQADLPIKTASSRMYSYFPQIIG